MVMSLTGSGGPSKSCSPPPTPDNGRIILVTDAVQGSIAFYQCFDGFELVDGSNRRVCQRGGTYSGRDPRCVPASGESTTDYTVHMYVQSTTDQLTNS